MAKVLPFRLQQCFDPFAMLSVQSSSETRLFRHLFDHVFGSRYFRKYISYEGDVFLAKVKKSKKITKKKKKKKKNEKKVFVFNIIASELVALNCVN